jgi:starch-binding outer membrane protein, SusD/RagB family
MKTNKILYAALIAGATLGTVTSCSDSFLDEKLITEKGTAYFQTKEGIDDLVKGAYQKLKFKYNYIWGIYLYGMGIDEFTSGANNITSARKWAAADLVRRPTCFPSGDSGNNSYAF